MSLILITGIFVAFVVLRIVLTLYTAITSPLRDIPGPFLARFTNLWFFFDVWTGKAHLSNIALHKKYANPGEDHARIVRLGPNLFSIASPEKIVYGTGSMMPKSKWYEGWKHPSPDRWTLFPDQDMRRHSDTRKKFQGLYSLSSLLTYESYVDECAGVFLQQLREMVWNGSPIDFGHWLQCYAFDVIGDITYSRRFGFLDEGKDIGGTMKALGNAMVYGTLIGIYPQLHPIMYKIMEHVPGSGAAGRNYIMKFVRERMATREAQRKEWEKTGKRIDIGEDAPKDFLDRIMDMQQDERRGVTSYHIFMLGLSNIIAGSDTTAVSLSSIFYNLSRSPQSLQKLRAEIDEFKEAGKCDNNQIGFKVSQEMRYLQACIKEGLRMHPATGLPLWRVVPQGGEQICGRHFPAGSEIGINTWVAHYDRDIWGEDADVFRPERWIEAEDGDKERLKTMEAYYMPFGLGSRTCLGRHISYLEISKLVPLLVNLFDFELTKPDAQWETMNHWFVKPVGFFVTVKERELKVLSRKS